DPSRGVRLATMHRMKGLEFQCVLIAGVNRSTFPLRLSVPFPDDASREDFERSERCLLYVAATRARDELVVTGYGEPSALLPSPPVAEPAQPSAVSTLPAAEPEPAASEPSPHLAVPMSEGDAAVPQLEAFATASLPVAAGHASLQGPRTCSVPVEGCSLCGSSKTSLAKLISRILFSRSSRTSGA
ncbi:MAG: ATP-binding domain-containing protein, partial [Armatimonadetes bacterium]|nr:ATP-binding domain-containing protein [Armatimonadota bacterium]